MYFKSCKSSLSFIFVGVYIVSRDSMFTLLLKMKQGGGRAFHFVEIQSTFCQYFRSGLEFLRKFVSSDPLLYLKIETSAHAPIAVIYCCILFTSFLT